MNIQSIIQSILPNIEIKIEDDSEKYLIISSFINEDARIQKIEQTESIYVDRIISRDGLYDFFNNLDNNFFTIAIIDDEIQFNNNKVLGFFSATNELDTKLIFFYSPIQTIENYSIKDNEKEDDIYKWRTLDDCGNEIKYIKHIINSKSFGIVNIEHIEYKGEIYDIEEIIEIG